MKRRKITIFVYVKYRKAHPCVHIKAGDNVMHPCVYVCLQIYINGKGNIQSKKYNKYEGNIYCFRIFVRRRTN